MCSKLLNSLLLCSSFLVVWAQSPGPRDHLGMTYDSKRDKIIVHSGNDTTEAGRYSWNPSTWEWDTQGWKEVDPGGETDVSSHSFVFDPISEKSIAIGGLNSDFEDVEDIQVWDGNNWQTQKGTGPGVRQSAAVAYDHIREEVVLFSGCGGKENPRDTWVFNENGWMRKPVEGPEGVCRAAMFFDDVRESIILFGGSLSNNKKTNTMWEWNGTEWNEVNQGALIPPARSNIQMAYDRNRKRAILFAGKGKDQILDDLWEWDGSQWREIPKQDIWPQGVEVYAITYHDRLKKIFLYGGRTGWATPLSDFWSWDGAEWTKIN